MVSTTHVLTFSDSQHFSHQKGRGICSGLLHSGLQTARDRVSGCDLVGHNTSRRLSLCIMVVKKWAHIVNEARPLHGRLGISLSKQNPGSCAGCDTHRPTLDGRKRQLLRDDRKALGHSMHHDRVWRPQTYYVLQIHPTQRDAQKLATL
jgi:hypothetical protein